MTNAQKELLKNVVIVDAGGSAGVRTAISRAKKGGFKTVRSDDLAAHGIKGILERTKLDPLKLSEVRLGCAFPEGEQGMQPARMAVFAAGLPVNVTALTINRYCSSGLQSIVDEIAYIACGMKTISLAGGMESMTMIPMGGVKFAPNPRLVEEWPETYMSMGLTAELLAVQDGNTREEQDAFALESHKKAVKALDTGKWKNEILPYPVKETGLGGKAKEFIVDTDECPRRETTMEDLAKLKPVFQEKGTVTAGNSSQTSDGAAVVMITTLEEAKKNGLLPAARLVSYEVAGVAPEIMGIGPVEAIPRALASAGLKIEDMDIIELNEAFASQSISVIKRLKKDKGIVMPLDKLNVDGGALALGHPLGCTGAYLTIKGINECRRRKGKYVMVTMCIGGGMGAAGIFEVLY
ncbi:MAG: thiolase family protein [Elusimicrobiota bacterium]|nr:thiolase family protein [Elusimicrobiota bacterium]